MRNVLISFLGTSDYLPCNYHVEGAGTVENTRFIQEALAELYCRKWNGGDEIIVLTTDESYRTNWLDGGHGERREGLGAKLEQRNFPAGCRHKKIPTGKSEEEIWKIFNIVVDQLRDRDNVYVDITHAFRSLPVLAMAILGYAKVVKDICVKAISYAAMEAVGTSSELKTMPVEQRNVPVFNLLALSHLQDWAVATDEFICSGNSEQVMELTSHDIKPILKRTKGGNEEARQLKVMADRLTDFTAARTTCRGQDIADTERELRKALESVRQQEIIQPLNPLLQRIADSIGDQAEDEAQAAINAAQWCLNHQLYQQGYTILKEGMVTFILLHTLEKDTCSSIDLRDLVNQACTIFTNEIAEENWKKPASEFPDKTSKVLSFLQSDDDLPKLMKDLTGQRNDINHCGFNQNPAKPAKIRDNLSKYIARAERVIQATRKSSARGGTDL